MLTLAYLVLGLATFAVLVVLTEAVARWEEPTDPQRARSAPPRNGAERSSGRELGGI